MSRCRPHSDRVAYPMCCRNDTFLHSLKPASKDSVLFLLMNGFLVACIIDCQDQIKAMERTGAT